MILTCPCYEKLHIMLSLQLPDLKSWQKIPGAISETVPSLWGKVRWSTRSDLGTSQHLHLGQDTILPDLQSPSLHVQQCTNTNFQYFCSFCEKVFIEKLQPEFHVRKISIKKNDQKEHLSIIHRGPLKCRISLLNTSWLMMAEHEYWQFFHWGSIDCINSCHLASHFRSGLGATQARPPPSTQG